MTIERVGYIDQTHKFFLARTDTIADKHCNTIMTVRYQWENPELAKSDWKPPADLKFGGGFSFFTPEEVRKGDANNGYYYEARVESSATADTAHNPIDFNVVADYIYYPNRPQGEIRLVITIEFKKYDPFKY